MQIRPALVFALVLAARPAGALSNSGPHLTALPKPAPVAPPPGVFARLEYDVPKDCPPASLLREEVGRRLRYDFVVEDAPLRAAVKITRKNSNLHSSVSVYDKAGNVLWSKPYVTKWLCNTLVTAMAGLLAAHFEVMKFRSAPVEAPPAASPSPVPSPSPSPPPAPPSAEPAPSPPLAKKSWGVRVGVGAAVGFGVGPSVAVGVSADVGFYWRINDPTALLEGVSLTLGGVYDPYIVGETPGGNVLKQATFRRTLASLAGCGHRWILFGCMLGELGQIASYQSPALQPAYAGTHAAFGGRFGVEVPFSRPVGFRVSADVLWMMHAVDFTFNEVAIWSTGAVAGAVGGGFYTVF